MTLTVLIRCNRISCKYLRAIVQILFQWYFSLKICIRGELKKKHYSFEPIGLTKFLNCNRAMNRNKIIARTGCLTYVFVTIYGRQSWLEMNKKRRRRKRVTSDPIMALMSVFNRIWLTSPIVVHAFDEHQYSFVTSIGNFVTERMRRRSV